MNCFRYFFAAFSLMFMASCSTDVDLLGDVVELPVVYGVINVYEPVNFIRVEKAFADSGKSALQLAADPDEIYYDESLVVTLDVANKGKITLERVHGEDYGIPRKEGIFANIPNVLYKIEVHSFELEPNDEVKLELSRNDSILAISSITLAPQCIMTFPADGQQLNLTDANRITVQYYATPKDPAFYQVIVYFNYEESTDGINWVEKELKYYISKETKDKRSDFTGREFYDYLGQTLEKNPSVIRKFRNFEFEIYTAGAEIQDYLDINRANLGITGSQEVPVFSNIEGGIGLLTSRSVFYRGPHRLSPDGLKALRESSFTKDLNFQ